MCTECGWFWWSCLFLCLEAFFCKLLFCWNMDFFFFLLLLYVWLDDNHTETHLILHSSQTPSYKWKITAWDVSMVTYSSMQRSDCMWCTYMLDRPTYLGKSANMTWHKNDALSKQTVFVQINLLYKSVNVYKTPRAWQEMHSCTLEKQWSLQEEELKGYHCSLTVQACQWDKRCALQKQ